MEKEGKKNKNEENSTFRKILHSHIYNLSYERFKTPSKHRLTIILSPTKELASSNLIEPELEFNYLPSSHKTFQIF